mmetsp:Transcript_29207/g.53525  ORF Transcript_29207/g.53525 Transcript_29207/m.53525 type:complete len:217 (+) Transcript_29207:211-861(+)
MRIREFRNRDSVIDGEVRSDGGSVPRFASYPPCVAEDEVIRSYRRRTERSISPSSFNVLGSTHWTTPLRRDTNLPLPLPLPRTCGTRSERTAGPSFELSPGGSSGGPSSSPSPSRCSSARSRMHSSGSIPRGCRLQIIKHDTLLRFSRGRSEEEWSTSAVLSLLLPLSLSLLLLSLSLLLLSRSVVLLLRGVLLLLLLRGSQPPASSSCCSCCRRY